MTHITIKRKEHLQKNKLSFYQANESSEGKKSHYNLVFKQFTKKLLSTKFAYDCFFLLRKL